jgi:DNA topoisomerase IB
MQSSCPILLQEPVTGKDVDLPPASEEVAGFYAAMIETDHAQDKTFNKNFFEDWKKVLKDHPTVRSLSHPFVTYYSTSNFSTA